MKNRQFFSKEGTGKGKCILSGTIVIILAVLAGAALAWSRSAEWGSGLPRDKMVLEVGKFMKSKNVPGTEQNITDMFPALFRSAVSSQGIMKILLLLSGIGNIVLMQMKNQNTLRILAEIVYTLAVTFSFGRWGICAACVERGYAAVGGEYSLIFVACWVSGMSISHFFDSLEGMKKNKDA